MDGARSTDRGMGDSTTTSILRSMLGDLPGSSGTELSRDMSGIEDIRNRAASGQMDNMSPQELHATLWKVLMFRDNVMKGVESTIEKIPGLSALVEKVRPCFLRDLGETLVSSKVHRPDEALPFSRSATRSTPSS